MTESPAFAPEAVTPAPRSILRRIVLFDIVLPVLAVVILLRNDAAPLLAYATASLFPAASIVASWAGRRGIDQIGAGVLVGMASSLLIALLTGDPRFGLIRAAPASALFGVACLVSLATERPLMFFVARAFATGGDLDRVAAWNARLARPSFRAAMRRLTAVWGAGWLAHAALGIAAAFLLPASVALIVEPAMAIVITAALLAWTRRFQRRAPSPDLSSGDKI